MVFAIAENFTFTNNSVECIQRCICEDGSDYSEEIGECTKLVKIFFLKIFFQTKIIAIKKNNPKNCTKLLNNNMTFSSFLSLKIYDLVVLRRRILQTWKTIPRLWLCTH